MKTGHAFFYFFKKTLLILPLILGFGFSSARAATLVVDSDCKVSDAASAIGRGSNYSGCVASGTYGIDDTIQIPAGTYCLSSALSFVISTDLTIEGLGEVVLDAGNTPDTGTSCTSAPSGSRVLYASLEDNTLTLKNLTLQGGTDTSYAAGVRIGCSGNCNVVVDGLTVTQNTAKSLGCGFYLNLDSSSATASHVAISNSRFVQNKCSGNEINGAGLYLASTTADALSVELDRVVVTDNTAAGTSVEGSGVYFKGKTLAINRSAIVNNTGTCASTSPSTCNGGGLYASSESSDGLVTLLNSSIGANTLVQTSSSYVPDTSEGGGLYADNVDLKISYSTIAKNAVTAPDEASGGGLYFGGTLTTKGLLLADNSVSASSVLGPDCYNGAGITVDSGGYNWIDDTTDCGFTIATSTDRTYTPTSPSSYDWSGLSFADNGGETETLALTSSASGPVNKGGAACTDLDGNSVSLDQRGAVRGSTCDIGAYEFGARERGEAACTDGIDNDGDSASDCSDASPATASCSASCEIYYADADKDNYGDATGSGTLLYALKTGYADNNSDCDDTNAAVNPDASELCNGLDDNCDGTTDDSSAIDTLSYYFDSDYDSYGTASVVASYCPGKEPSTYVANSDDCDDFNTANHPGATEMCDDVDNDCDDTVDEGFHVGESCTVGTGACASTGAWICDTFSAAACSATAGTPGIEDCSNGIDDDCDGLTDSADTADCTTGTTCTPSTEDCSNGIDDDCDGLTDSADTADCPSSSSGSGGSGSNGSGSSGGSGSSNSGNSNTSGADSPGAANEDSPASSGGCSLSTTPGTPSLAFIPSLGFVVVLLASLRLKKLRGPR